ncbi:MAG: hypothetical protein WDZ79_01845 [Candidatus Paceibacterota bacterium]
MKTESPLSFLHPNSAGYVIRDIFGNSLAFSSTRERECELNEENQQLREQLEAQV